MRLKLPFNLKSNSGSSLVQALIASGVAFVVLYFMTDSMINLNKQSNVVNLKLEVSNLATQLESIFSKRSGCSANMTLNGIRLNLANTVDYTGGLSEFRFDTTAAGKAPVGIYDDAAGTNLILSVVPPVNNSRLTINATDGDDLNGYARIRTGANQIIPVPPTLAGTAGQYAVTIDVAYGHNFPGLISNHKPIELKGITMDVDATGAVVGCQLAPRIKTVGCEVTGDSTAALTAPNIANADQSGGNLTFVRGGRIASIGEACENPVINGTDWTISCRSPFTLGGCSSSNLLVLPGSVISNVKILPNGCAINTAATDGSSKMYITCIGNN